MEPTKNPIFERFMSKVQVDSAGCWQWSAYRCAKGYGRFRLGGRNGRHHPAHRVAYELYVGPIPEGLEIDHLCRNRGCVNPGHLQPVTHAENVARGEAGLYLAERTHCKNGHAFTPDNTIQRSDGGGRGCRECSRARTREWHRKNIEHNRERMKEYYRRNRDKIREKQARNSLRIR